MVVEGGDRLRVFEDSRRTDLVQSWARVTSTIDTPYEPSIQTTEKAEHGPH